MFQIKFVEKIKTRILKPLLHLVGILFLHISTYIQ